MKSFYPRHPRGWRQMPFGYIGIAWFVSIHATLAGGDVVVPVVFYCRPVSIHATLAGGDLCQIDQYH